MEDEIADGLAYFDEGFRPNVSRLKSSDLAIGVYSVFVDSVQLERSKDGQTVVAWVMTIDSGPSLVGKTFEHSHWLTSAESVGRFGGELKAIGFDTDRWLAPSHPFSKMLPGALRKCIGCRIDVSKTTYVKKDGGVGSNLRLTKGYMPMEGTSTFSHHTEAKPTFAKEADLPF